MNILFFIPELSQKGGGIRQYAIALLKILIKDKSNTYYILHNVVDPQVEKIVKNNDNLFLIPSSVGTERWYEMQITNAIKLYNFIGHTNGRKWRYISWSYIDRICKKYKIDIVHSPFQFSPYTSRKNIWTLHDVQELHFPEYFSPEERERRSRAWLDNIKRGDHLIVSYKHVKDDLIKYFRLKEKTISICLLNMNDLWFSNFDHSNIDKDFIKLLPEKFLLFPANTWAHKNHIGLIEALRILKEKNITDIKVYCTGHKNDFYYEEIVPLITRYELNNQVIFTGILDENKLYTLYRHTRGVVITTKYEAGSFPLIESILLDVPVICSNVTSLPETIGNLDFVFDPNNYFEIASMIEKLYFNDSFLDQNRLNLALQKPKLINNNTLECFNKIYNEIK